MAPQRFSLPSRLNTLFQSNAPTTNHQENYITEGNDLPCRGISNAEKTLLLELKHMYWSGVKHELIGILFTLKEWQLKKYESIILDDETDDFIHGFDTFVDQVNENSHKFACKERSRREKTFNEYPGAEIESAFQDRATNLKSDHISAELKAGIRENLNKRKEQSILERRARMLLQSAGFLDIDKLIEHRRPLSDSKPTAPQLTVSNFDINSIPIFTPLHCDSCKGVIRGCTFSCNDSNCLTSTGKGHRICEDCYWDAKHAPNHLIKSYKQCILQTVISPELSQQMCQCVAVAKTDSDGHRRSLFPVSEKDVHQKSISNLGTQIQTGCKLLNIGKVVAEAKYQAILGTRETKKIITLDNEKITSEKKEKKQARRRDIEGGFKDIMRSVKPHKSANGKIMERERVPANNAEEDIPWFMRNDKNFHPFGNVHMALRIGPLVIENGVKNTKSGALITNRVPNHLQLHQTSQEDTGYCLALTPDRQLYSLRRGGQSPKRYKTIMKQVVSGAFTGAFDETLEDKIIALLITESQGGFDDESLTPAQQAAFLEKSLECVLTMIQELLESRVDIYLTSIAAKLLDKRTDLRWDSKFNNCQNFCDSLIDINLFGSLMAPPMSQPPPYSPPPYSQENQDPPLVENGSSIGASSSKPGCLYLMSFVCRPGNYDLNDPFEKSEYWNPSPILSKYDVPLSLTEEYLLRFRYGQHNGSDIIDTQQEYWHDWGAFGGSLYKYQDVFPWDCTEAYGRYGVKCGSSEHGGEGEGCNISKHVWSFPYDSHGIIALHLTRSRGLYPPASDLKIATASDEEWMRNRLTVLLAQDCLLAGMLAMYRTPAFLNSTSWLSPYQQPDPKLDRVKLGGIHRAQPFSHHFERGTSHDYFIAEWAHRPRAEQIAAYEALRDRRMRQADVHLQYEVPGEYYDIWGFALSTLVVSAVLWSADTLGPYGGSLCGATGVECGGGSGCGAGPHGDDGGSGGGNGGGELDGYEDGYGYGDGDGGGDGCGGGGCGGGCDGCGGE